MDRSVTTGVPAFGASDSCPRPATPERKPSPGERVKLVSILSPALFDQVADLLADAWRLELQHESNALASVPAGLARGSGQEP